VTWLTADLQGTAHGMRVALDRVQADTPAGQMGYLAGGREAGAREQVRQRPLTLRPLGYLERDAPAVVGDDNLDQAAAGYGPDLDVAAGRLAG
jgi:hypothetical protein